VLVTVSSFHPSLIFARKVVAYPSGRLHSMGTRKYKIKMEVTNSEKDSSLLRYEIKEDCVKFRVHAPGLISSKFVPCGHPFFGHRDVDEVLVVVDEPEGIQGVEPDAESVAMVNFQTVLGEDHVRQMGQSHLALISKIATV
jgi:hypothetical protein